MDELVGDQILMKSHCAEGDIACLPLIGFGLMNF